MKTLRSKAGFSLVEVTLAIGVVAFAFVSIFGLIPVGLGVSRKSMDTQMAAQIALRLIGDMQQTSFNTLVGSSTATRNLDVRYYNSEGTWGSLDPNCLYYVNQRIVPATTLPSTNATNTASNSNLATITVQVAYNPAHQALAMDTTANSPTQNLWTGAYASTPTKKSAVQIYTYSSCIARNDIKQ